MEEVVGLSSVAGFSARERRRVGHTGLEVSVLGLGAAPLGGLFRASSPGDAIGTVRSALEAGVNFIDVAPHYGQGLAELRIGAALASLTMPDCVISTKVGRLLEADADLSARSDWPEALPFQTVYDATDTGIRRSIDDSAKRLGRVPSDILLLHDPDRYSSGAGLRQLIKGAYRTLSELRADGLVQAIGIGVNSAEPCHLALDVGDWDCILLAGTYSVVRQDDQGLLERCHANDVAVFVGGPFMSGALAGGSTWRYGPIPDDVVRDIARLEEVCRRHDVPTAAAALQFALMNPAVASVVTGMRSSAEVVQNVALLGLPIAEQFWRDMAAEGLIR